MKARGAKKRCLIILPAPDQKMGAKIAMEWVFRHHFCLKLLSPNLLFWSDPDFPIGRSRAANVL
jgi:hypothetical protein